MTSTSPQPNHSDDAAGHASAQDAALDAALRGLHRELLTQPVPTSLLQAGEQVDAERQRHARQWQAGALAASVVLAFATGWLSHGQLAGGAGSSMARAGDAREFVRQASFAHAVYLPEKRHPVEVSAEQQDHLVQWLSKRLDRALKVPQLGAEGFELVGGRLLPGDLGARAQFMFQNATGQRVTLYLGAIDVPRSGAGASDVRAAQFRFEADGPVPSFYWAEDGFGYALSGQVEKATLLSLATLVYRQLH